MMVVFVCCSTVVMAPVVAGSVVGTILPLLAATILGYCITGYIRDALFGRTVKKCIGPFCNIIVSPATRSSCHTFIHTAADLFVYTHYSKARNICGYFI